MSIRYLPAAVKDLNEALAYYTQRNVHAAQRFVDAVRASEQTILDSPRWRVHLAASCAYCG